jgi:hypothetical protein
LFIYWLLLFCVAVASCLTHVLLGLVLLLGLLNPFHFIDGFLFFFVEGGGKPQLIRLWGLMVLTALLSY